MVKVGLLFAKQVEVLARPTERGQKPPTCWTGNGKSSH